MTSENHERPATEAPAAHAHFTRKPFYAERVDYATKLLKESDGSITDRAVEMKVAEKFDGQGLSRIIIAKLRKENGVGPSPKAREKKPFFTTKAKVRKKARPFAGHSMTESAASEDRDVIADLTRRVAKALDEQELLSISFTRDEEGHVKVCYKKIAEETRVVKV